MVTIHELFQNDGQKSRIGTTYNKILYVPESVLQTIREYLDAQSESEYQGEDNTIIYTAKFPDGREMDIKCCGCQEESSWKIRISPGSRSRTNAAPTADRAQLSEAAT